MRNAKNGDVKRKMSLMEISEYPYALFMDVFEACLVIFMLVFPYLCIIALCYYAVRWWCHA